jgi:hypothetical protein
MSHLRAGQEEWLWVSEDGRLLTVDEIAAESGGTVQATMQRGVKVLKGTGVIWGGAVPSVTMTAPPLLFDQSVRSRQAESTAGLTGPTVMTPVGRQTPELVGPNSRKDLLATDPKKDLLGNGADLLR